MQWKKRFKTKLKKIKLGKVAKYLLWLIGVYVSVYTFYQVQYEFELNRLTTRFSTYVGLLSSGKTDYHILSDFILLQTDSIHHEVSPWYNPLELVKGYTVKEPNLEIAKNVGRIAPVFIDLNNPGFRNLTSDVTLKFEGPGKLQYSLFDNDLFGLDYRDIQFDVTLWRNKVQSTRISNSIGSFKTISTQLDGLNIDKSCVNLYLANYGSQRDIERFSAFNSFISANDMSVHRLYFDEANIANSYFVGIDIVGNKLRWGNLVVLIDCSLTIDLDSLSDEWDLYNSRDSSRMIFYNSKLNGKDTSNIKLEELGSHLKQFDSLPFDLRLPIREYLK